MTRREYLDRQRKRQRSVKREDVVKTVTEIIYRQKLREKCGCPDGIECPQCRGDGVRMAEPPEP